MKFSKISEIKFDRDTQDAYKINTNVLNSIINKNKSTEFGVKYEFSKINSIEEYKKRVPLSKYDDYEKYIMRMCRGEKNILTAEDVSYFGMTSGTTGKQKLIPVTKTGRNAASEYMSILSQRILYNNFKKSWSYGRGLILTDIKMAGYTEGGIPICSATAGGITSIKRIIPYIWTTPVEAMDMPSSQDSLYIHLLFALKESRLMYVSGVFISSVLDMFRYLEKYWKELVLDIRKGRINRNVQIDENIRKELLKKLSPDAERADFLEKQFKDGFKGIARRIWPKLIYIISVTGANFSIYDDKVAEYTDNLPVYSSVYAATEATIGINRYIEKQRYIIIPGLAFLEFIPIKNIDDRKPETKTLNELNIGSEYEIVITSTSGLYRYRLGDVVKVVDYYNNSPEIEFLYRSNQLLNMVAEKTTEEHAVHALTKTFKAFDSSFYDYTVMADNSVSPGKYIFFVELKKDIDKKLVKSIAPVLDMELGKANLAYERHRHKGKLAQAEVKLVKAGTFDVLKNMAISSGVSKNQFKVPRVLKKKDMIDMMNKMSQ